MGKENKEPGPFSLGVAVPELYLAACAHPHMVVYASDPGVGVGTFLAREEQLKELEVLCPEKIFKRHMVSSI